MKACFILLYLKDKMLLYRSPMNSSIRILFIFLSLLVFWHLKSIGQNNLIKKKLYTDLINEIKSDRDSINKLYSLSAGDTQRQLIRTTEEYLVKTYYTRLLAQWLGTKWEFYGETQIPGDSSIACGHFVVTTLKHLGINPEQSHEMATNFSTYMVNSLCDSSYKVYKPEELIRIVEQKPDDVWVVGLHNHSGLLVKYKGQIRFVHSSYSYPTAVVDEPVEESHTLQHSTIYVAGNL